VSDVTTHRSQAYTPATQERSPRRAGAASESRAVPGEQRDLPSGFAGAGRLSAAMLASGVLAYAFHVLAARSLGVEAYGQVSILWAALFLVVVVLFRPLEQTVSRGIADRLTRGLEVRTVMQSVGLIYLGVAAAIALVAYVTWGTLGERLFLGDDVFVAALVVGTCGYGVAYIVRGVCSGARWFNGAALGIMADAAVRLAVALPLVVVASSAWAAGAVAVAAFAGSVLPLWFGRHRLRSLARRGPGVRFRFGSAAVFAGPAAVVAGADQLLVNGGPLLVMIGSGPEATSAAGIVFAATMLVRIPVYVFQGTATSLLPNLTTLNAHDEGALFRRTVWRAAGLLACAATLIVAFAATVGPPAMRLLFGREFRADRTELTLLGLGVAFYLAAATISQALFALDRGGRAAVAWGSAAIVFVGLYALLDGTELARIAEGFAVATGCCAVLVGLGLVLESARSAGRPDADPPARPQRDVGFRSD
jgi:O-antigen/teichoic acid export membrane protein